MVNKVLVTGGTSGIGYEVAKCYMRNGWHVVVVSRSDPYADDMAWDCFLQADLSNVSDVRRLFEKIDLSSFTTLVNCAGQVSSKILNEIDSEHARNLFELNFFSPLALIKEFILLASENPSSAQELRYIVNLCSIAGIVSRPGSSIYAASKYALRGLTRSLAVELGGKNILVNSVSPGPSPTPMLFKNVDPAVIEKIKCDMPLGRLPSVKAIADAVFFLGSQTNQSITGQDLVVDSGLTLT